MYKTQQKAKFTFKCIETQVLLLGSWTQTGLGRVMVAPARCSGSGGGRLGLSPGSTTVSFPGTLAIHFHRHPSLENGRGAKMNFRNILALTLSSLTVMVGHYLESPSC